MSVASTTVVPFPITNEQFLQAVFRDRWGEALVAYFLGDPQKGADWRVYPAADVLHVMAPAMNNYWDVSLPNPGGGRKTADFGAIYAVVLDDYGVKVAATQAKAILGEPSYIIETSPGSFHAGWFTEPLTDRAWVHGMLRALYEALGRTGDNLVKPTTLVRLPVSTNGKAGLGAAGFRVKLTHWQPDNRIQHLDWPAIETRIGAVVPVDPRVSLGTTMPDPAEIEADLVLKVFRERGMVLDHGHAMPFGWGFEVECPWAGEHTDTRSAASYIPVKQRFKCHHGHCQDRTMADVRAWADASIREDSGGLESLASLEFDEITPGPEIPAPYAVVSGGQAIDLWDDKTPPAWSSKVLPAVLEDAIGELSERDGLDLGALGATTVTAASGASDKRSLLSPYAGSNWTVPPVLWLMLIAEPGQRKTAILAYVLNRLRRLNAERMQRHGRETTAWRLVPAAQRQQPPPTVRVLLAEDTTVEKLQEWMSGNPRGLLSLRDEMPGFFDFGRYSNGGGAAERAAFLEFYEGGPTTISRMTRVTTIDNCALSVIGGIQPHKLADLKGLSDDGMLSRFGTLVMQPGRGGVRKSVPTDLTPINSTIDRLLALGPDHYRTDAAGETLIQDTETAARGLLQRPDLGAGFRGFINKLHGLQARVALVLHLMDGGQDPIIPVDTVMRAGRYAWFLFAHAEVFYAGLAGSSEHTARTIGSYLLLHPTKKITTRDLRSNVAPCRKLINLQEFQNAVFPLVLGGWLQPETHWPSNKAWLVNPGIWDQFAARTASEKMRVEGVKQAMNHQGRYR